MSRDQPRREAVLVAQQKLAQEPLYLDTETTGLGPYAEVVEISILDAEGGVVLDKVTDLVGRQE